MRMMVSIVASLLVGTTAYGSLSREFQRFRIEKERMIGRPSGVNLIAVGDIMLSRGVARQIAMHQDSHYPFRYVHTFLNHGDITFGNLEGPITSGASVASYARRLRADPGIENALKKAGFSLLSLANNHMLDFGAKGLHDTMQLLTRAGIAFVGADDNALQTSTPVCINRKGITFAFLAYVDPSLIPPFRRTKETEGYVSFMDAEVLRSEIQRACDADIIVVSMHAGTEYADLPDPSQIAFARAAIDAGADIVLGHHPHVMQPVERYKGKYIFYSLGNFVFDQMASAKTREGLAVKVLCSKNGIDTIVPIPIRIEDTGQPRLLAEHESAPVVKKLHIPNAWTTVEVVWNPEVKRFEERVEEGDIFWTYADQKQTLADLDHNGHTEFYILKHGRLSVIEGRRVLWKSPSHWWIDDFALADSTGDGGISINLSVWRAGNYGRLKPFWVTVNDMSIKNHFFVLDLKDRTVKSRWSSSNLSKPNCEFRFADLDGDGKQEMVVVEGEYTDSARCTGKYIAIWKWNGWGFSNTWRGSTGRYNTLHIVDTPGGRRMMVKRLRED